MLKKINLYSLIIISIVMSIFLVTCSTTPDVPDTLPQQEFAKYQLFEGIMVAVNERGDILEGDKIKYTFLESLDNGKQKIYSVNDKGITKYLGVEFESDTAITFYKNGGEIYWNRKENVNFQVENKYTIKHYRASIFKNSTAGSFELIDGTPVVLDEATGFISSRNYTFIEALEGCKKAYYSVNDGGRRKYLGIELTNNSLIVYKDLGADYWLTVDQISFTPKNMARAWVKLADLPHNEVNHPSIAISSNGTPYVAYTSSSGQVLVMKYNGVSWEDISASLPTQNVRYTDLVISPFDKKLYIAYTMINTIQVMTYNGQSWRQVGVDLGMNGVADPNLTIAPNGIIYLAYLSKNSNDPRDQAVVQSYLGSRWLAQEVVNTVSTLITNITNVSITVAYDGTPYVAYTELRTGLFVTIKNQDKASGFGVWGDDRFVTIDNTSIVKPSIAVNPDGTLYIAVRDIAGVLKVKKFNGGTNSTDLGSGFRSGYSIDITFSGSDLYTVSTFNSNQTVSKWNDPNWDLVGGVNDIDLGTGESDFMMLAIFENIPYVGYRDLIGKKIRVMKYDSFR
ncbi:MAG: hypothetical protein ACRCWI_02665 [Brevinema sp.]